MRSIISSLVLKSDVSERNGSRFSVLVIRKPLQPVLDSRTRTALAVVVFVRYPACCTHAALLVFIVSSLFTAVHSVYCLSKLITPGYWFILKQRECQARKKKVNNLSNLWISAYWRRKPFQTIQFDLVNWFDPVKSNDSFTNRTSLLDSRAAAIHRRHRL